jgi:hypothetical protein
MDTPQWERSQHNGRERWNYVTYRPYPYDPANKYRNYIGYITKTKNKHRCRDWRVYTTTADVYSEYVTTIKNLKTRDAKAVAQLLLGAQQ